jgi:Zincin-like metallopeptidase
MRKSELLSFDAFSARAQALTQALPPQFLEGIESVDVHREKKPDPVLPDVLLLGECVTSPLSALAQEEAFRSTVHLYHGSFVELAHRDASFDLEDELRETIEHEIQHHIEDRAGVTTLAHEDDLFEAHARFKAGLEVAPGWYRRGEQLAPQVWAVDLDLFVELPLRRRDFEARRGTSVTLHVLEQPLEIEIPADADPEEIFTVEEAGLFEPDVELEEGAEPDEDTPGTAGDLHLVPLVR